jgi:hypothetical protein
MILQYDREELYQKIWERPLIKVAQDYGVSAVALGKTCRKLCVPMPGRGYWAKLAHGHIKARKPPLPKLDKVPTVYRSSTTGEPEIATAPDPEFTAIEQLRVSGTFNPQPTTDTATEHVLVRRTKNRLRRRSRKDERGMLLPSEPGGLDVRVTAGTLDRSLHVMSSMLAILEAQGFTVETPEQGGAGARVNDQLVLFCIEEKIQQVVAKKPRVPNPTSSWDYERTVSYEATGALALVVQSDVWPPQNLRKRWSDGKTRRVEDQIPEFVAGLMRMAVALRRQADERKKREEERMRREQELIKLREEIEAEEKKHTQFNQWVDDWEKAERLRRFIAVYVEKTAKWSVEKQPHYKEWIQWANQQADRLDPFISDKPPSVLDRKHEIRSW